LVKTRELRARIVAEPVAALGTKDGRVVGRGETAAYLDFGGFVVAITGCAVPLMPNAISLWAARIPRFDSPLTASLESGALVVDGITVDLSSAQMFGGTIARNDGRSMEEIARRCAGVLDACATVSEELLGSSALFEALTARDAARVGDAVDHLLGRGDGLTPEGDDLISGATAALVAFGGPAGLPATVHGHLREALCPADRRLRTTSLSATLLELAAAGKVVEPLLSILDLRAPPREWRDAVERLVALGHSTGRALCVGCARAGAALARVH
jgi:Protein of unknown function (DUF2877)